MYLKHAKLHNKMKDSDTMVALFNESCKILIGNPYMQGPSIQRPITVTPPAGVIQQTVAASTIAQRGHVGGGLPINNYSFGEFKSLNQKQFEQEQRLQMAVASMRELLHDQQQQISQLRNCLHKNAASKSYNGTGVQQEEKSDFSQRCELDILVGGNANTTLSQERRQKDLVHHAGREMHEKRLNDAVPSLDELISFKKQPNHKKQKHRSELTENKKHQRATSNSQTPRKTPKLGADRILQLGPSQSQVNIETSLFANPLAPQPATKILSQADSLINIELNHHKNLNNSSSKIPLIKDNQPTESKTGTRRQEKPPSVNSAAPATLLDTRTNLFSQEIQQPLKSKQLNPEQTTKDDVEMHQEDRSESAVAACDTNNSILNKNAAVSVANATINTVVVAASTTEAPPPSSTKQPPQKATESNAADENSPKKLKKTTDVILEKMESLTALAFDPKRARPGPKRSSLLVKQGFTNVNNRQGGSKIAAAAASGATMSDPLSQRRQSTRLTQKQQQLKEQADNIDRFIVYLKES